MWCLSFRLQAHVFIQSSVELHLEPNTFSMIIFSFSVGATREFVHFSKRLDTTLHAACTCVSKRTTILCFPLIFCLQIKFFNDHARENVFSVGGVVLGTCVRATACVHVHINVSNKLCLEIIQQRDQDFAPCDRGMQPAAADSVKSAKLGKNISNMQV